jgi:hypothetical protein
MQPMIEDTTDAYTRRGRRVADDRIHRRSEDPNNQSPES